MKILAFDTATAHGSVAVLEGDRVLSLRDWQREKSHSEFLTSEIEEALRDSSLNIQSIDRLAVGQGPGSFTGLRVAINAARSLAYALKKPVSVFETPEILVEAIHRDDLPVLVAQNAQKNSYFVARFEFQNGNWSRAESTRLLSLDEVQTALRRPHLCVGDGCLELETLLAPAAKLNWVRDSSLSDFPSAKSLGLLAYRLRDQRASLVWNEVQPLYLRASGAEEKLREVSKR